MSRPKLFLIAAISLSAALAGDTGVALSQSKNAKRTDLYGDPLPEDAIARFGTARFRHGYGRTLAYSPDSKTILTFGGERSICTWDVSTGRLLQEQQLPPGAYAAENACFSRDGKLLAFQDNSDEITLWDVARRQTRHTLALDMKWQGSALAFSPDGNLLVVSQNNGTFRAWDTASGETRVIAKLRWWAFAMSFTADSKTLVASVGQKVHFWDLENRTALRQLEIPEHIYQVTVSPDGKTLASWTAHNPDKDKGLEFWDALTGAPAKGMIPPGVKMVHQVHFAPDGKSVYVAQGDGFFAWDPIAGKKIVTFPGDVWQRLVFAPDGKSLAAFGGGMHPRGQMVYVWDRATGKPHPANTKEQGHQHEVESVAFGPDGRMLAAHGSGEPIHLWDVATRRIVGSLPAERVGSHGLAFSPNGRELFVAESKGIVVFEVSTGREVRRLPLTTPGDKAWRHLLRMELIDNAATLLATVQVESDDPNYRFSVQGWEVVSGKRLGIWPDANRNFDTSHARFSPDGRRLVLDDGSVRDVATGREIARLPGEKPFWRGPIAFSPDGGLLATGIGQKHRDADVHGQEMVAVQVWESATLLPVMRLETKEADVVFSADGFHLLGVHTDGLRLWDLTSGKAVASRVSSRQPPEMFAPLFATSFAVAADGHSIATGHADTNVLLWDLPAPSRYDLHLDTAELEACWKDLAGEDAGRALQAMARLVKSPKETVVMLRERLQAAKAPPADELRRLIADLDSDQFKVREAATKRLIELDDLALAAIRAAVAAKPSLEMQRRLEKILTDYSGLVKTAEGRRQHRAVRVLGMLASTDAREVLALLAKGAQSARTTQEAQATLQRLRTP